MGLPRLVHSAIAVAGTTLFRTVTHRGTSLRITSEEPLAMLVAEVGFVYSNDVVHPSRRPEYARSRVGDSRPTIQITEVSRTTSKHRTGPFSSTIEKGA
jgi:hypothetical protein